MCHPPPPPAKPPRRTQPHHAHTIPLPPPLSLSTLQPPSPSSPICCALVDESKYTNPVESKYLCCCLGGCGVCSPTRVPCATLSLLPPTPFPTHSAPLSAASSTHLLFHSHTIPSPPLPCLFCSPRLLQPNLLCPSGGLKVHLSVWTSAQAQQTRTAAGEGGAAGSGFELRVRCATP
jgi:hypothetical protein